MRYVIVWIALMVLALLSFFISNIHMGVLDIVFAMGIAVAKTLLVVLIFMELIEHRFINTLIVLVSTGFVALLLSLMIVDVFTRHTFPPAPVPLAGDGMSVGIQPSRPRSTLP